MHGALASAEEWHDRRHGRLQRSHQHNRGAITIQRDFKHRVRIFRHVGEPGDPDRHFRIWISRERAWSGHAIHKGVWELEFQAPNNGNAHIHLWCVAPESETAAEFVRPLGVATSPQDESRKDELPTLRRPENWIRGTLQNAGACEAAVVVASYNAEISKRSLSPSSSQGPAPRRLSEGLYEDAIDKPDIAAPGISIDAPLAGAALHSRCSVDSYVAQSGSSLAAPHIAGVMALMWAQNNRLMNFRLSQLLKETARIPTDPDLAVWSAQTPDIYRTLWGAGMVDAEAAVKRAAEEP